MTLTLLGIGLWGRPIAERLPSVGDGYSAIFEVFIPTP